MMVADAYGCGDTPSLQEAVDRAPCVQQGAPALVRVRLGEYRGRVTIAKSSLRVVGDLAGRTVIVCSDDDCALLVTGDNVTIENITFKNESGRGASARVTGKGCAFVNCRFEAQARAHAIIGADVYLKDCEALSRTEGEASPAPLQGGKNAPPPDGTRCIYCCGGDDSAMFDALSTSLAGKAYAYNEALAGYGAKRFMAEGLLSHIEHAARRGDIVLMQFALGDAAEGAYHADARGTFVDYLRVYIDLARQRGALPVLVTPPQYIKTNADDDYVQAVRDVAYLRGVPRCELQINASVTDAQSAARALQAFFEFKGLLS